MEENKNPDNMHTFGMHIYISPIITAF